MGILTWKVFESLYKIIPKEQDYYFLKSASLTLFFKKSHDKKRLNPKLKLKSCVKYAL